MNKLSWGNLIILFGCFVLSLELYGLKFYAKLISVNSEALLKYNNPIKTSIGVLCGLIMDGVILVILHFIEVHRKGNQTK